MIGKSYELARDLHRYERDQEGYESEKKKLKGLSWNKKIKLF